MKTRKYSQHSGNLQPPVAANDVPYKFRISCIRFYCQLWVDRFRVMGLLPWNFVQKFALLEVFNSTRRDYLLERF